MHFIVVTGEFSTDYFEEFSIGLDIGDVFAESFYHLNTCGVGGFVSLQRIAKVRQPAQFMIRVLPPSRYIKNWLEAVFVQPNHCLYFYS